MTLLFYHLRESSLIPIVMEMAETKVLLNNISVFRDGLVSFYFKISQFGLDAILAHNTIFNIIECQELSIRSSGTALIHIGC